MISALKKTIFVETRSKAWILKLSYQMLQIDINRLKLMETYL